MKLVTQGEHAQVCGAACLAMLAGVGLEAACQAHRFFGPVRAKVLVRAICKYGWSAGECSHSAPVCNTALVFWRGPRRVGHWVVLHLGNWFDCDRGILTELPKGWTVERHWPLNRHSITN